MEVPSTHKMDDKEKEESHPNSTQHFPSRLYETRSVISRSSKSSSKSSASMAAAKARARAEAVHAQSDFVKRQTQVMLERARLEAELVSIHHDKEVTAALVEARDTRVRSS